MLKPSSKDNFQSEIGDAENYTKNRFCHDFALNTLKNVWKMPFAGSYGFHNFENYKTIDN